MLKEINKHFDSIVRLNNEKNDTAKVSGRFLVSSIGFLNFNICTSTLNFAHDIVSGFEYFLLPPFTLTSLLRKLCKLQVELFLSSCAE